MSILFGNKNQGDSEGQDAIKFKNVQKGTRVEAAFRFVVDGRSELRFEPGTVDWRGKKELGILYDDGMTETVSKEDFDPYESSIPGSSAQVRRFRWPLAAAASAGAAASAVSDDAVTAALRKELENGADDLMFLGHSPHPEEVRRAGLAVGGAAGPAGGAARPARGAAVKVAREVLMTEEEAQATNNKLPPGYRFAPVDRADGV